MSRLIMQQALDAFESIMCLSSIEDAHIIAKNARYGLREELAKPEQEPVAWRCTSPPCRCYDAFDAKHCAYGYTAPPRKPWVGLTSEELAQLTIDNIGYPTRLTAALEAKLKEKNGDSTN